MIQNYIFGATSSLANKGKPSHNGRNREMEKNQIKLPIPVLVGIEPNPGPPRRQRTRRRSARRANGLNPYSAPMANPFPFPLRTTVEEVYSDQFSITSTSGIYQQNQFRMNSTFDPDYTNAGHQPYGRDILASVYAKYRVTHFKAEATALCITAGNAAQISSAPSTSPGLISLTYQAAELPYGKISMINNGGPAVTLRTPWISLPDWMGQSLSEYLGDDSNESVVGSNPTTTTMYTIGQESPNGTTTVCQWAVKLTYRVTYFNAYTQSQS
jgi:hypothetical protein